jgi:hypothetical protein
MLSDHRFVARAFAILGVVLGLCGSAWAVAALGPAKRVDVDPTASAAPIYRFGLSFLTRTPTGGFAAAWEEDSSAQTPNAYERIRFRIYGNTFAPVAAPQAANLSGGKRLPGLWGITPLGSDKAYLFYALTRDNNSLDHPTIREAFGQKIALATGAASGARQLLNPPATGNWDSLIGIPAGLQGGRAVFGWYESDNVAPAPGRFISSAGVLQPATLDFACCGTNAAQLVRLQPLGTGFLADYVFNSIFTTNDGIYARVFNANGQPASAAKFFLINPSSPIPKALSNGRIVVFRYVQISSNPNRFKLMAQLYTSAWAKIGTERTLVPDLTTTKYVDFTPTLDGGLFMIRTLLNGSVYTRSVRRLNANLVATGTDYTFAGSGPQALGFRIAALSANRAVVLYPNIVGGRHRLFAQIVSY